nr:unnamed protein product [Digitaria exilis]
MASSAGSAAVSKGNKHPRVLLPFTCDSLRIPDEIAEGIGAEEAVVFGPTSGEAAPWRVEVGWDGDGASWAAGGRSSRARAAPAWPGTWSSATAAAVSSPSRRSTPAAASGSGSLALPFHLQVL